MKNVDPRARRGGVLTRRAVRAGQSQNDPQPTCNDVPGDLHPEREIQAYAKKAIAEKLTDQQVRDIEHRQGHVGIGVVHRGKLDCAGAGVGRRARPRERGLSHHRRIGDARHRPDLVGKKRRPADLETVRLFNGPGNNSASIRNGVATS